MLCNGRLSSSSSLEVDDLVSAGGMGLLEALERYDASRDNRFATTFAEYRIPGAMIDLMRLADHVSRYRRIRQKRVTASKYCFFKKTGREATSKDLEELTGLNQEQIAQVRLDSVSNPLIPMEQDPSEDQDLLEVLHDDNESNALDVLLDINYGCR